MTLEQTFYTNLTHFHFRPSAKNKKHMSEWFTFVWFKDIWNFQLTWFLTRLCPCCYLHFHVYVQYYIIPFPDNTHEYSRTKPIWTELHIRQHNSSNTTNPQDILRHVTLFTGSPFWFTFHTSYFNLVARSYGCWSGIASWGKPEGKQISVNASALDMSLSLDALEYFLFENHIQISWPCIQSCTRLISVMTGQPDALTVKSLL